SHTHHAVQTGRAVKSALRKKVVPSRVGRGVPIAEFGREPGSRFGKVDQKPITLTPQIARWNASLCRLADSTLSYNRDICHYRVKVTRGECCKYVRRRRRRQIDRELGRKASACNRNGADSVNNTCRGHPPVWPQDHRTERRRRHCIGVARDTVYR